MTHQPWLITGGAGYIGAHIADAFLANGKSVILLDSMRTGLATRVEYLRFKYGVEIPLIKCDLRDSLEFEAILARHNPLGVIHTAALKSVAESLEKSDEYFEVNLNVTSQIVQAMSKHGIHRLIFSSSAAVYGSPKSSNAIPEDYPTHPISPYGESKLAAELEVNKFLSIPGNHGTSLRFFNVVGAAAPALLDNSGENLVPIVIKNLKDGLPSKIFGVDYPTLDGTCIRDYVDVRDIASAHLAAADADKSLPDALNVGTGKGASVREIICLIYSVASFPDVITSEMPRRFGDPAALIADTKLIRSVLNFKPRFTLKDSIESIFRI